MLSDFLLILRGEGVVERAGTVVNSVLAGVAGSDVFFFGAVRGLYPAFTYKSGNAFRNRSRRSVLRRLAKMGSFAIDAQTVPY